MEKNKEYFKDVKPDSAERFLDEYASKKVSLVQFCKNYQEYALSKKDLKYREHSEKIFEMILQKKLWDIQLKWRAEQFSSKDIRVTTDFIFWEQHIHSCPFLPMVTDNEVEVMKQFLQDPNYADYTEMWFTGWQDYDELMEIDEDGNLSDLPEWYQFYDGRMGTGILLQNPDIRGKKELYYRRLAWDYEELQEKINPPPPVKPYVPPLRDIYCDYDESYSYACFAEEDKHFVELFRLQKEKYERKVSTYSDISNDDLDYAITQLKEAEAPVIMQGGCDWREAIVRCSQQYLNDIVSGEIDIIYGEYKMFIELGLTQSNVDADIQKKFEVDSIFRMISGSILKGRELNGDPPDLDF